MSELACGPSGLQNEAGPMNTSLLSFILLACILPLLTLAQPKEAKPKILIGGKTPSEVLIEFKFQGFLALNDRHWQSYRWIFSRTDANGDGRHSKEEYIVNGRYMTEQSRRGIFQASDHDKDGFVSAFEYFENRIITDEAKLIFEAMDGNLNGQLTRAEFMASKRIKDTKLAAAIFKALDTNSNGELVIPEYLRVWGKWARY